MEPLSICSVLEFQQENPTHGNSKGLHCKPLARELNVVSAWDVNKVLLELFIYQLWLLLHFTGEF